MLTDFWLMFSLYILLPTFNILFDFQSDVIAIIL
jgi:hypothetical protein